MHINFPEHRIGAWQRTPFWMFWRLSYRRRHWRWCVDHGGCECTYYWQYAKQPAAALSRATGARNEQ